MWLLKDVVAIPVILSGSEVRCVFSYTSVRIVVSLAEEDQCFFSSDAGPWCYVRPSCYKELKCRRISPPFPSPSESAFIKEINEVKRITEYQLKKLVMNLSSNVLIFIDLLFQTEETDQRLSVRQSERDYWLDYKNVGSRMDANKIKNLKRDIREVKDDFERSSGQFTPSVMKTF